MTSAVRTALLAALAAMSLASCGGGGGGGSPPASPPPPPPPPPPAGGAPVFSSATAISVLENAAGTVYRATAADPQGTAVTYTFGGTDAARFAYNSATQQIRFLAQPDFESPADAGGDNAYDVTFTASDGTNTTTQNVRITVSNVANGFRVRRIASGLNQPIFVTGYPDGSDRVAVVERAGRVRLMNPVTGVLASGDFLNLVGQVATDGERGMLSIAFSPNFIVDRTFYLHLNNSAGDTQITQYRANADFATADTSTANPILTIAQPAGLSNHKGGYVGFDNAGRLLISMGDGGANANAQNTNTLLGKILRIDPTSDAFPADNARDYAIPAANPFASGGGSPEIMAVGLRNPFRASVDPITGDIFIGDVGEGALEEIDRIPAGATGTLNFGWSVREGSQAFGGADSPAFTLPVTEYSHGGSDPTRQGSSLTGGVVYRGPVEDLQGLYAFGDFVSNNLWTVPIANLTPGTVLPSSAYTVRNTTFAPDVGTINSVVNFGVDNAFNLLIVDIGGEIFRIEPLP